MSIFDDNIFKKITPISIPLTAADFDYESPISIIREMIEDIGKKQAAELDNQTLEAVLRVGIQVDKEELIKALAYDRGQYSKGFNDGFEAGKKARWTKVEDGLPGEDDTVYGVTSTGDLVKAYIWDDCGETKWYADGCYDACIVKWMPMPEEEQNDAD